MITLVCIIGFIILILWEKSKENYANHKIKKNNKQYLNQYIKKRNDDESKI